MGRQDNDSARFVHRVRPAHHPAEARVLLRCLRRVVPPHGERGVRRCEPAAREEDTQKAALLPRQQA